MWVIRGRCGRSGESGEGDDGGVASRNGLHGGGRRVAASLKEAEPACREAFQAGAVRLECD
jgi:hypothetical protein